MLNALFTKSYDVGRHQRDMDAARCSLGLCRNTSTSTSASYEPHNSHIAPNSIHHGSDIQTKRGHCAPSTILPAPAHTASFKSKNTTQSHAFFDKSQCTSYTQLDAESPTRSAEEKYHIDGRHGTSQVVRSLTR